MDKILNKITNENSVVRKDSKTLQYNRMQLSQTLSKQDKKLLLRIIDEKDLIIEDTAFGNFEKGFCHGVRFAFEVFSKHR